MLWKGLIKLSTATVSILRFKYEQVELLIIKLRLCCSAKIESRNVEKRVTEPGNLGLPESQKAMRNVLRSNMSALGG